MKWIIAVGLLLAGCSAELPRISHTVRVVENVGGEVLYEELDRPSGGAYFSPEPIAPGCYELTIAAGRVLRAMPVACED